MTEQITSTSTKQPQATSPPPPHRLAGSIGILSLAVLVGCSQEMDNQRRVDPQEAVTFFNGSASRPLPEATFPADPSTWLGGPEEDLSLNLDQIALTGRENGEPVDRLPEAISAATPYRELLERGQTRFRISCSPCHDLTGSGKGMVPRRGFPFPPTYHSDRLRAMPVGYFFTVATEGKGPMPPYRDLLTPEDRWAVAAYVRALQLSQHAPLDTLSSEDRAQLEGLP